MEEGNISLDMNEEKLRDKNYNLEVLSLANFYGYVDENNRRRIDKKEFMAGIKNQLHLTKYKCGVVIQTLIDIGAMEEDKDYYYLNPVSAPFLKLYVPTVRYCLKNLNELPFKVYCYLLNKFNMHTAYAYVENYYFSIAELLRMSGYNDRQQKNILMMHQCLNTLEDLELIHYNHESVGRPGHHGVYHELYNVNQYSSAQVGAATDTIKQLDGKVSDGIIEDLVLPGVELTPQLKSAIEQFMLEQKNE